MESPMESIPSQALQGAASMIPETPGAFLASERQRQGLSVGDVAAKLRMGIIQIEALERSDYGKLPTGTFLRGFVRSYAKLLGLDQKDIIRLLELTHPGGGKPGIVVPSQNIKFTSPGEQFSTPKARAALFAILVLALALGGWYWWIFIRPEQLTEAKAQPVKVADAETTEPGNAAPMEPINRDANTPAPQEKPPSGRLNAELKAEAKNAADLAVAKAQAASRKPAVPGGAMLHFAFLGESWVEVVDGNGKTLISHRYKEGEEEELDGKGPFSVVIGNTQNTRLTYNGADFDLIPHTRVSVARFMLK
jgi:cytoskeleton protein RodZ